MQATCIIDSKLYKPLRRTCEENVKIHLDDSSENFVLQNRIECLKVRLIDSSEKFRYKC